VLIRDTRQTHYGMKFSPGGRASIFKWIAPISTGLGGRDVTNFKQELETNHLEIIAQGPQIAAYMNGELLWFVHDESLSTGRIVLRGSTITDSSFRVQFDNLRVWDISDLALP